MYLLFALFLAYGLIVWFDSDAVYEYAKLLNLGWIHPALDNYINQRGKGSPQSLIEYLQAWHDSFVVRLITCPKCLSGWLGGLFGLMTLIPACRHYGTLEGLAYASALPFLTYFAYQLSKKLK